MIDIGEPEAARPTIGAALVTGAARGIGRAIAVRLARSGFDLAINDLIESAELEETARIAQQSGAAVVAIGQDISDIDAHDLLLETAQAKIGPLTTLVNNAGVSVLDRCDLLQVSAESYDRCQNTNARAMFFLTQAFTRRLLARPRRRGTHQVIVNITSVSAAAASVKRGEYCVSKAAAAMVSQLFAARLAGEGVQVFDVRPGIIETEMTRAVMGRYRQQIQDGELSPIRRPGQPEEIADIVALLAAGGLPFTAGQVIMADGGLLLPRL